MRRLVFLVACVVAAGACSKKSDPAPNEPAGAAETGLEKPATDEAPAPVAGEPAETAAADAPVAVASSVPEVELVEAGKEPRQPVRLEAPVGTTDSMKLTLDMSMGASSQGKTMPPAKLPAIVMVMKIEVVEATPDERLKLRAEVTGVDVGEAPAEAPPGTVEQAKAQLDKLVGLVQTSAIDRRGFVADSEVTLPESAPPEARQMIDGIQTSLQQFAVPMPEEPLGVGAVWKVTRVVDVNGIPVSQTNEYTLVSRKGPKLELAATVTQQVGSKFVELPQVPGMKLEIEEWDGKGEGTISMNLQRVVPASSVIEIGSTWTMKANGQSVTYELKSRSSIEHQK